MGERVGVFLCECGPNIKDRIELDELLQFVQKLEHVVFVKRINLVCSLDGQKLVSEEIKNNSLTRVVIAACSPKEHELTFHKILKDAGLNPFLLQIANIREQCAWVISDKGEALTKAKSVVKAAVARVVLHEPLEIKEIDICPEVLVVGAGVAGMKSALTLAQKNRKVYLVERSPCIGGKVARFENLFPNMECASCMLDPVMDDVLHNKSIDLYTYSEVTELLGSYGNFVARINKKARYVDTSTCIGCGQCIEICPVKVKNEFNESLDERRAIYIPYPGSLPNVAVIDKENCLHLNGKECAKCVSACPFGCINLDDKDEEIEIKVGAVVLATGFDLFDSGKAQKYGHGKIENIFDSMEF
ncbi:MAG: 4Fe-4S dicluster domain-containing protein, partial [Pseudomonadota bacterium]